LDWPSRSLCREGLSTVLHRAQALELCRDPFGVVPADVFRQLRCQCVGAEEPDAVEEFVLEVAEGASRLRPRSDTDVPTYRSTSARTAGALSPRRPCSLRNIPSDSTEFELEREKPLGWLSQKRRTPANSPPVIQPADRNLPAPSLRATAFSPQPASNEDTAALCCSSVNELRACINCSPGVGTEFLSPTSGEQFTSGTPSSVFLISGRCASQAAERSRPCPC
jgi:hypothetical protein